MESLGSPVSPSVSPVTRDRALGIINGVTLPVDGGWIADGGWDSLRLRTRAEHVAAENEGT